MTVLFAVALGLALPVGASAVEDNATKQQADAKSNSIAPKSSGEVKKVDKDSGKVTIKHGPIENLGMPAMTMVFMVKNPPMLERMNAGDKINFVAERVNGAFTVIQAEAAN